MLGCKEQVAGNFVCFFQIAEIVAKKLPTFDLVVNFKTSSEDLAKHRVQFGKKILQQSGILRVFVIGSVLIKMKANAIIRAISCFLNTDRHLLLLTITIRKK